MIINDSFQRYLEYKIQHISNKDDGEKFSCNLNSIISHLLNQIKTSNDPKEIEIIFDVLQFIHNLLNVYIFKGEKYKFMSDFIVNKFMSDFDRIDDLETRNVIYNLIEDGKY